MTRGLLYALAAVLTLGSCRSVTAPSPARVDRTPAAIRFQDDAARGGARRADVANDQERAQVPVVTRTEATTDGNGVHFRLHLAPERREDQPFYAPHAVGGWQFQVFLNVDREVSTGYALGFEYVTRDSESDLESGTVVLRRTEGGGGPGGWGDEIVRLPVRVLPRLMMFTIPNSAIEDDGVLDYWIDFYATVPGGADGETPVAAYVRDVRGSSGPRRRDDRDPTEPTASPITMGVFGTDEVAAGGMDRRISGR